jgi:hypothetical protein
MVQDNKIRNANLSVGPNKSKIKALISSPGAANSINLNSFNTKTMAKSNSNRHLSLIGGDKTIKSTDKIHGKNFLMSLSGIAGLGLQKS